jgi:hypothetical protein
MVDDAGWILCGFVVFLGVLGWAALLPLIDKSYRSYREGPRPRPRKPSIGPASSFEWADPSIPTDPLVIYGRAMPADPPVSYERTIPTDPPVSNSRTIRMDPPITRSGAIPTDPPVHYSRTKTMRGFLAVELPSATEDTA